MGASKTVALPKIPVTKNVTLTLDRTTASNLLVALTHALGPTGHKQSKPGPTPKGHGAGPKLVAHPKGTGAHK